MHLRFLSMDLSPITALHSIEMRFRLLTSAVLVVDWQGSCSVKCITTVTTSAVARQFVSVS